MMERLIRGLYSINAMLSYRVALFMRLAATANKLCVIHIAIRNEESFGIWNATQMFNITGFGYEDAEIREYTCRHTGMIFREVIGIVESPGNIIASGPINGIVLTIGKKLLE
jgi:hypothetical protein